MKGRTDGKKAGRTDGREERRKEGRWTKGRHIKEGRMKGIMKKEGRNEYQRRNE